LTPGTAFRWGIPPIRKSVHGTVFVTMKSTSEVRLAGLAAVRITWITAIALCVLATLSGLLSGSDGGNSSPQFPGFAFTDDGDSSQLFPDFASLDPAAGLIGGDAQRNAQKNDAPTNAPETQGTETAGPQGNRGHRVDEQAPGDNHSRTGVPQPGAQPEDTGGGPPSSAPAPNRPQAPAVSPPKTPQAPTVNVNVPKPPQAPSVSVNVPNAPPEPSGPSAPSPSLPSLPQVSVHVSAPVETPLVKVPDVNVQLP
jgi:hypothetical protein